ERSKTNGFSVITTLNHSDGGRLLDRLGHITTIYPKMFAHFRAQRLDQLTTALGLHRFADIDLTHSFELFLRDGAGEHEERISKVWAIELTQFVQPHTDRTDAPGRRPPPAILARSKIHLPALHHQLPLQRSQLACLSNAFFHFHTSVMERRKDRRYKKRKKPAAF